MARRTLTDRDGDQLAIIDHPDGFVVSVAQGARGLAAGPFTRAQLDEALGTVAPAGDGTDHDTTGEALARLQAELTRLLDEADAELRDEADGGVAAALIEKDALAAAEARPLTPHTVPSETVEQARDAWINAGGRVYAGLTLDLRHALAAALPVAPGAMTAREHLDAAWEAAHVPADGIIPEGRMFLDRGSAGVVVVGAAGHDLESRGSSWERRLVDPPAPARPEGAEDIDEHLRQANAAALGGALTPEQRRALADHLAGFGYRNPLDRAEEDPR